MIGEMRDARHRPKRWGIVAAGAVALAAFASCSKPSPPPKPVIQSTKAFDAVYGELPSRPLQAKSFATVAYFPSALEPEKFRPVPIFSVEEGKEEALVVRTVIRGIEVGEGPADAIHKEIVHPFPPGSELGSFTYEGALARVTVGGSFRPESLSPAQREKAAKALALTVFQFGRAERIEVTDASGAVRFGAVAKGAETIDIGSPKILGLMAIREEEGQSPVVLSVLFDRPVFVEEAAVSLPGADAAFPGKVYSTGFGMTLEFHPEPKVSFDPGREVRIRLVIRGGKGRRAEEEQILRPKLMERH